MTESTARGPFAVVGPSGVGKDTVMEAVAAAHAEVCLVRRIITRDPEAGGESYEAVDPAEFARRKARGAFVLDWQAHGLCYGIPAGIKDDLAQGRVVLFNGSRLMLREALRRFPDLEVLHITARPDVLAERLRARGRESAAEIAERLDRTRIALPDGLLVHEIDNSGDLSDTVAAVCAVLQPVKG